MLPAPRPGETATEYLGRCGLYPMTLWRPDDVHTTHNEENPDSLPLTEGQAVGVLKLMQRRYSIEGGLQGWDLLSDCLADILDASENSA